MTSQPRHFNGTEYLTTQEGAEHLGISVKTLRRRISEGVLPAYRLTNSRSLRLRLEDVEAS